MNSKNQVIVLLLGLILLLTLGCVGTSQETGLSGTETIALASEEGSTSPVSMQEEEPEEPHLNEEDHTSEEIHVDSEDHSQDEAHESEDAHGTEEEHVEESMDESGHVHEDVPVEYTGYSKNPYWDERVADYETAKAEGKEIYEANCVTCHGPNGLGEEETNLPGVATFADRGMTDEMTPEFWFWRISEGVSDTTMTMWKNTLTEDQIWKVMVYEHSFSHDEPHKHADISGGHDDGHEH
jgi:mono/diheme cytochrome c family protein